LRSRRSLGNWKQVFVYDAHLKRSWTHLITQESELCGGAVTVSFSKYLPWQAMHFLQRSTHFLKRAVDRSSLRNFLPRGFLFMVGNARHRIGRDLDCMADVLTGFHRSTFSKPNTELNSDLAPRDFWSFPTMKRELLRGKKFRSDQ
jgi:hypothetical protein